MKPLEGLLVVSVEQALAAPFCTARLLDAGARVIKIERVTGDFARVYDEAAKGDSSYFVWTNQGKESIVLNYKEPEDHALMMAIIAKADVLVQNLAPGAMARSGFGSDVLREKFPKLITCDISGYGESEEMKSMKAYDLLVQAETGLVSISGGKNELGRVGVSVCDIGAGMTAHAGILEALIKRGITGKGIGVKVSLFDVTADWMTVPLVHAEYGKGAPTRQGLRHPSIAPYGAYETCEGDSTIISIQNEREWQRLCSLVLELPSMGVESDFVKNTKRVENRDKLDNKINAVVKHLSADEFRIRLGNASIAYGALNSVDDLGRHKALRRRRVKNSLGSVISIPAPPIRFSDTNTDVGIYDKNSKLELPSIPSLGSSTEAIRAEFSKRDI